MKKLFFFIMLFIVCAIRYLLAQTIENFESIPLNVMLSGSDDQSTMTIVANPDPSGINTSATVVKFVRDKDGLAWTGFWSNLLVPLDLTDNKFIHVKVWKPRISPLHFKIQSGPSANEEIESVYPQILTNEWEDIVFDFSDKTGLWNVISFMPDFMDPVNLTDDIIIYFDDIILNNDPNGTTAANIIEDFEFIPLNLMVNNPITDLSTMTLVSNPDISLNNPSATVIEFLRDKDGYPWCGFWSPTPIDLTDNKYVHVKVWKPRISPLHFKVIGGPSADEEVESMYSQTITNQWEDIVFDFSDKTGIWTMISFMPDFEDPLTLTDDITIYFDDILISNDSTPIGSPYVTFNVDMTGAVGYPNVIPFDPSIHEVYLSGDLAGFWPEPGSDSTLKLSTTDQVHYTISLPVNNVQHISFKYFFAAPGEVTWNDGEWTGDPNRHHIITGDTILDQVWGDTPALVTFFVDMSTADPFNPETDDVYMAGELLSNWNEPGTIPDYKMEPFAGNPMIYTLSLTLYKEDHDYKYFRVINDIPSWENSEWPGEPFRTVSVTFQMAVFDVWGLTTGIYDNKGGPINFYPNPVNDRLIIDDLVNVNRIEIFNVSGARIQSLENISGKSIVINTSGLTKGLYILTISSKNGVQTTKFIK